MLDSRALTPDIENELDDSQGRSSLANYAGLDTTPTGRYIDSGFEIHRVNRNVHVRSSPHAAVILRQHILESVREVVVEAVRAPQRAQEDTWVEREFGIASLFVRVDHVGSSICEVEMRPCGGGVVAVGLPLLGMQLRKTRLECWNGLNVFSVVSPRRKALVDDIHIGIDVVEPAYFRRLNAHCIVRAEPDEEEMLEFQPRSIAPIATEGDRCYGIDLLWSWFDSATAPWEKRFVVKGPGARSVQVYFWDPSLLESRESFLERLPDNVSLVMQLYFDHHECHFAQHTDDSGIVVPYATLHRSFFFFDIERKRWVHAGSCWVACPKPPVHGTPEMIMGPVEFV